jgi:Sec-independent protein translocase protein TatA
VGRSVGKGMREFKDSLNGITDDDDDDEDEPSSIREKTAAK